MNEYDFDLEFSYGTREQFRTCAINKIMAYDMLTEYLDDCGIDPKDVRVLDVYVEVFEEEEE